MAFDLSTQHCGACKAYHGAWPYVRLINPPRGVDADRERLLAVLAPLLAEGSSVLLAGSADAGLAECVLDAAEPQAITLDVVDLCETPLRQCVELLSARATGRLRTWQASIAGAPVTAPVDVIIAHSVLPFLPRAELSAAASFMRNSLKEGGHLVMTISLRDDGRQHGDPALMRQHVLEALAAQSIPLPTTEAAFAACLEGFARGRAERSSPFTSREEVMTWLSSAGLDPVHDESAPRGGASTGDGPPGARSGRGLLVVARKRAS